MITNQKELNDKISQLDKLRCDLISLGKDPDDPNIVRIDNELKYYTSLYEMFDNDEPDGVIWSSDTGCINKKK